MSGKQKKDIPPGVEEVSAFIQQHGRPVLMQSEFRSLVKEISSKGLKQKTIKSLLEESGITHRKTLKSDYKDVERIAVPSLGPTPYHYAVSLRSGAYLSHGTAVHLLGLTQQQPKTIYVNKEQGEKPQPEGTITQESIDTAFSRPQRRSNYIYRIDGFQIVLLSGKGTGRAGVISDQTTNLPMTCLERTLVDITVRPRYAGGVFQVAQAFASAVKEIDPSRLLSLLAKLNYRYPYHQAIGFYLERAGADKRLIDELKGLGLHYNFYLDYVMANPGFDESWRVFYPLGV